ncbi:unnamed protein product [Urochloa humidicola]
MASFIDAEASRAAELAAVVIRVTESATRAAVAAAAREAFLRSFANATTRSAAGLTGSVAESRKVVASTALASADQVTSVAGRHAALEAWARSAVAAAAAAAEMARALADVIRAFASRRRCLPFEHDFRRDDGGDGASPSMMLVSFTAVAV